MRDHMAELHAMTDKNLREIEASNWPSWMKDTASAAVTSRHASVTKKLGNLGALSQEFKALIDSRSNWDL